MAQAVAEFQSLLSGLAADLERKIERLVPSVARMARREQLAFVTDAFPDWVAPHLAASADLTTVWYDDQLTGSPFQAVPADVAPREQLAASARWGMLQSDPATALSGSFTRALFDASRDTVVLNTTREGVRWSRYASASACGFCRMLAIRGPVYGSEQAALASHDHCHCVAVPMRDGKYDPAPYIAQWRRDYKKAIEDGARSPGQIANAMDKAPTGRRYNGDDAGHPVDLDEPQVRPPVAPVPTQPDKAESEGDAAVAARLLPGLEKSLADLRAKGLPESSPQIQYHLAQIAKFRRRLKR